MLGLGWQEMLIVLALALLLFGGKRIPGIARSLGQSIIEFKKGVKGIDEETDKQEAKSSEV